MFSGNWKAEPTSGVDAPGCLSGKATVEANAQPLERELIVYEKGIPELLEVDTPLLQLMEKQEADPASNRATRIPLLTQIGGTFQQVSMDGVALGSTSGPVWNVA